MWSRVVLRFAALLTACTPLSCDSGATLYSVEGKLYYKGEPATGALVVFHLVGDTNLNSPKPSAMVGADGSFKLQTGPKEGAPAGEYVVALFWEQKKPTEGKMKLGMAGSEDERASGKNVFAGTPYAAPDKSPLKATVNKSSTVLEPFRID